METIVITKMETQQLKEYDLLLNEISKNISFYKVNPINALEEKEKFFSDPKRKYNPQFKYSEINPNMQNLKQKLEDDFLNTSIIANVLNEKRKEYLKKIEMLSKLGTDEFSPFSINVYGLPDDELIEKANELLKLEDKKNKSELTTQEVIKYFRQAIKKYGFDWNVVEKKMIATAAVAPSKKTLFVRENSRFSYDFIKRLIVHEIGTHALRAENGWLQEYTIFRRGFPGYMATEEGLAVVNEELNNVLNKRTLKIYASRVIAVNMALTKSFNEIFSFLSNYFDEETAWRTTLRAKRGIADTSKSGGLTKDYLYLEGYYKVKKYIQNGNDINKLYVGKIGIEHIALTEKLDLESPKYLPNQINAELIVNG